MTSQIHPAQPQPAQPQPAPARALSRRKAQAVARLRARAERARALAVSSDGRPRRVSLWLPTTALFALLAPFAVMLVLPLLCLAPRRGIPDPVAALFGVGRLLLSLGGTSIDVDAPGARVRLRLF